jgi:CDP-paratose 2-epimerase
MLEGLVGRPIPVTYGDWRPGDQRVFVADISKAEEELDWQPLISPAEGIRDLYRWVAANPQLFS